MIPQELVDIQKFLSANVVQLSKKFQDGRINASINEDEILQVIDANFDIELPPPPFLVRLRYRARLGKNPG